MGDAVDEKAEAATPAYPAHTAAFADALAGRNVCAIGIAGTGASSVVTAFIAHLERRRAFDARRATTGALPRPTRLPELVRFIDGNTVRSLADNGTVDTHTRFVCAMALAPASVANLAKLFPRAQLVVHSHHAWREGDEHYVVHRFHELFLAPADFDAIFRAHFRLDEADGGDGGDNDNDDDDDEDDVESDGAECDQSVDEVAAISNEENP
jgi:hypothetical protein